MGYKSEKIAKSITISSFRYLILIGLSFLIIYPLITTIVVSFMNAKDVLDTTVRFISKEPTLENYKTAIIFLDYGPTILKSVLFNTLLCIIEIISCLFIAYGFARFRFPFKSLLFSCVLLTLLVPYQIYFSPLYLQFQSYGPFEWNLLKTPLPMLFMSLTGVGLKDGLIIYIMRQSFSSYPKELEEAATVDGAGALKVFTRIILPGAVPFSMTCFMFEFVWKYTDPTFSEVFLPNQEFIWNIIGTLQSRFEFLENKSDYYFRALLQNASVVLYALPIIILFMFAKRFLVESIETTGLVG